jgi:hypothetical protein
MRRWIYGANLEGLLRSTFDGFRMGHEVRVNGDLQFVLLPLNYESPKQELRAVIETNYSYIGNGRLDGRVVPGSTSSQLFMSPGIHYIIGPRLALEMSYQVPVTRVTGPQVFRTDGSAIIGVRFSY